MDEYLDPHFGAMIEQLIEISKSVPLSFADRAFVNPEERPLLINRNGNKAAILSKDLDNAFNLTSSDISRLLSAFVKRHNIISPLTGELMRVTPRRLRYTLATGLAAEGISKRELARILDHTDTQHVNVYFEMAGRIVQHLDKATAKGFSTYLNFFRGRLINSDENAVNGERDDKHLTFSMSKTQLIRLVLVCVVNPVFATLIHLTHVIYVQNFSLIGTLTMNRYWNACWPVVKSV